MFNYEKFKKIGDRVKGLRPSVLKIQGSVINKDDT